MISPALWHSRTSPASLIDTPRSGSSATRYIATSEPNGFCASPAKPCGAARNAEPSRSPSSNGVLILTFASFDAAGHSVASSRLVASS